MGLFDNAIKGWNNLTKEVQKGWDSFEKNELQQVTNWVKDNTDLDKKVVEYIKEDPSKAAKIVEDPFTAAVEQIKQGVKESTQPVWERDSTKKILGEEKAAEFKENVESIPEKIKDAFEQGVKESTQPVWERDSTKKILGEDGADKLQDVFNPARWAENAIEETPLSPENKDALKKYLPVVALGAGALILLSALK